MNIEEKIKRINELYHKSQAEGLTEAEKEEQADFIECPEYAIEIPDNIITAIPHMACVETSP